MLFIKTNESHDAGVLGRNDIENGRENTMTKDVKMPHEGHDLHLCLLHNIGLLREQPEEYSKLVKDAKYMCMVCGRVAISEQNLCAPKALS
jgi:hypothetical protein